MRSGIDRKEVQYGNGRSLWKISIRLTEQYLNLSIRRICSMRALTQRQFSIWQGMRIVRQLWTFTRGSSIINQRNFSR